MSQAHAHINSALKFIAAARPAQPLSHQLKEFFAADKKYGSSDRRKIGALVYGWYRLGKALTGVSAEQRMDVANFLLSAPGDKTAETLSEKFKGQLHQPLQKKMLHQKIGAEDIFPFFSLLSPEIDADEFAMSFLQQPDTFIRIRPGKELRVAEKIAEEKVPFEERSTSCFAFPPATKLEKILRINKDAVIQDESSQHVFNYLLQNDVFLPKDARVWDCCAASGGKSILLYDLLHGHLELTVSDVRGNILENLRNRFRDAGITRYHPRQLDLTENIPSDLGKFDVIICDAPCTGSGTWSRTPEQLYFFEEKTVADYAAKQLAIAGAAAKHLKPGGLMFYITCSVFREENESVADNLNLQVLHRSYVKGYSRKADTLFVTVLQK